jgi:hypothetical protein
LTAVYSALVSAGPRIRLSVTSCNKQIIFSLLPLSVFRDSLHFTPHEGQQLFVQRGNLRLQSLVLFSTGYLCFRVRLSAERLLEEADDSRWAT